MENKKNYISADIKITDLIEDDIVRTSGKLPGLDLPDIDLDSTGTILSEIKGEAEQ